MPTEEPLHCPLHRIEVVPRNPAELVPLLTYLRTDAPIADAVTFPCGTVLPDGRLDLCKQALGPAGCRQVVNALEANTRVVSLMLGTDGIGNAGAGDVARLVERNTSIEVLYLGCNNIDAGGISPLAEALANRNTTVSGLWLKRNPLGAEGARRVASLLQRSASLRVLDLVNTWPGDGMAHILEALAEGNCTVERVYLGGNGLGPGDAPRLAALLRARPTLRALLLNVGQLGGRGGTGPRRRPAQQHVAGRTRPRQQRDRTRRGYRSTRGRRRPPHPHGVRPRLCELRRRPRRTRKPPRPSRGLRRRPPPDRQSRPSHPRPARHSRRRVGEGRTRRRTGREYHPPPPALGRGCTPSHRAVPGTQPGDHTRTTAPS